MRYLGVEALKVETAGQSSDGALVQLIGIVEGDHLLRRRRPRHGEQRDPEDKNKERAEHRVPHLTLLSRHRPVCESLLSRHRPGTRRGSPP
jgi:hypothetical protein